MRAGKLDKIISLQRTQTVVDAMGTPSDQWTEYATTRAQIIQATTQEFMASSGTENELATVFRIRWRGDLQVADRVAFAGLFYDVKEIKELGRRAGIDVRCTVTTQ